MEPDKYSLNLREHLYKTNLYKSTFTHTGYFNVFNSCRVLNKDETCMPLLSSFTSINSADKIMFTQSFPKSKAFCVDELNDECLKIVQDKQRYNKYFQHCRRKYKMQSREINKSMKRKKGDIVLPFYIINLSNKMDPDQYFDTYYDWYYTGGVLDTINIDSEEYFVGILKDNLCIRYLNNAKVKQEFPLNEGHVFNIKSYAYNNNYYISLRGKNYLKLMHCNKKDVNFEEIWKNFDDTPYIDFKLYSSDTIGSINMQNIFKCTNIQTQKTLIEHRIVETDAKPNRYCLFDSIDKQNLIFMDRKTIKSFDLRSSKDCVVLSLESFPLSRCEELCYFIPSKSNSNYIFACTNHTITKVDLRQKNIIKQWSHLLTAPPIMMDSLQSGYEHICISSFKDRVILCSTPQENHLPKLVPNPMDAFNEVNLQEPIILEGLNKRLQSSINGIKLSLDIKNNDIAIHYSNSFGDIFCNNIKLQSISHDSVDNKASHEKMKKWLRNLQRKDSKRRKIVYATEIATKWSSIKQLHCKNILEENLAKYRNEPVVQMEVNIDPYDFDMGTIWRTKSEDIQLPEDSSVKKVVEWLSHVEH